MRPKLHFTASSGWINDPHGITFRDGKYHSFFQHVPSSIEWAPSCHWGHAVGVNLFSMVEFPIALAPGDGDDGIWTGTLLTTGDNAKIFYTSINTPDFGIGKVRSASPVDADWVEWKKGEIVAQAPNDLELIAFRDPFIKRESNGWRMFLGAGSATGEAMALSYFSADLENWTYEGKALSRSNREIGDVWTGSLWECPQFIKVQSLDVMISSIWDDHKLFYAAYALGEYKDGKFDLEKWGRLTFGDSYYAPSYFEDSEGAPCLQFWMRDFSDPVVGWAGAHSIPFRLLEVDGDVHLRPHPDLISLRVPSATNETEALTGEIIWDLSDSELQIHSGNTLILTATEETPGYVSISLDGSVHTLPSSKEIRVILDGPILEVSTGNAVFGAKINPEGRTFKASSSSSIPLQVYSLAVPGK